LNVTSEAYSVSKQLLNNKVSTLQQIREKAGKHKEQNIEGKRRNKDKINKLKFS